MISSSGFRKPTIGIMRMGARGITREMNDSFVRDDKVVQEMVRLKHQVSGNEYGTSRGDSRRERARCVVNQC